MKKSQKFHVDIDNSMILKSNGEIWVCGRNEYGQLGIGENRISILSNFIDERRKIEKNNLWNWVLNSLQIKWRNSCFWKQ